MAVDRLDRAIRLFEFLARVQQIKSRTPRTLDAYLRDGDVMWFHALPNHPAVRTMHRGGGADPADPMFTIDRVPRIAPPSPPDEIVSWLITGIDDPSSSPRLADQIVVEQDSGEERLLQRSDTSADEWTGAAEAQTLVGHPEVTAAYERWLQTWSAWASVELASKPVRDVYGRLFSMHIASANHPEELELACGVACLGWQPEQHERVQRHVLTAAAAVDFDDETARLTVRAIESTDTLTLELDMLDPAVIPDPQRISEIREAARSLAAHPLDRDEASVLGRRLVHSLDPDGQYLDDDHAPAIGVQPMVAYAPAIILRKRSQQGLVHVFEAIASQIREAGEVPEGVLPLIDPNHLPDSGLAWDGADGAMVTVDEEIFLPLPVNDAQLRVIKKVDRGAQTLVQGPPGTGKTHTAAALISHLLAQGKRVLVTAQTDRALKEVRSKLPEAIRPLSVAVVGAGREDMTDLKVAVERIAAAAVEREVRASQRDIERHLEEIDALRRQRASLHHRLIDVREAEVRTYERPEMSGTLAAIAQGHSRLEPRFRWIRDLVEVPADAKPPLSNLEIGELRRHLLDDVLRADEPEAAQDLIEPSALSSPDDFSDVVQADRAANAADLAYSDVHDHDAFEAFLQLPLAARETTRAELRRIADEAGALARRREAWMAGALSDIQRGRATPWRARRAQVATLVSTVQPLLERLGSVRQVRCNIDPAPLIPLAMSLRQYLHNGGKLKKDVAGRPKVGALANRTLKEAVPLFGAVSIDGVPPTTVADLDHFVTWVAAEKAIAALNRAWPDGVPIPAEDTLSERLHWHVAELEQLDRLLKLADGLRGQDAILSELGLLPMDWGDLEEVRRLGRIVGAVDARQARDSARKPLVELETVTRQAARWQDAAPCLHDMCEAVRSRDTDDYRRAWDRLHHLLHVREILDRRDELAERLSAAAPRVYSCLDDDRAEERWDPLLATFEEAWNWGATGSWITSRDQIDVNLLQRQLDAAEEEIRRHVEAIAAGRAWRHAVSSDRITGQARADLEQYAYLVRRLGKGTGRYAAQRRAEIRDAMDRCRPSVPVWILPIYRIAEQLRVAPDIFDVVVVDEASQAGLEATFLQYLAPKIVVIGDDKQVSPSAVGIEEQQLRDLAAQYLYDDPYRASWQDPRRSLFDEAKMRYGGLITLVEHRRCVPEIIGFSNRIAYEPEGIRLIPVRQYGADRLEPIKPVFLPEGYTRGGQVRINPVEVEAIVDQVEKCLADPAYDGLTFGVISLLGTAQAKQIEKALLERISPEEWTARDLRCGDSADFQGSERDVVFISMVAAPEPGRRLNALTQQMYLQRYNVAASRAKDQMWIYHSIALSELGNPEDLRFQLLDYCYATVQRSTQVEARFHNPVPEDVKVAPFDSLFEQRVFNRLIDRGYSVIPQFEVEGYRIDLVIPGSKTKVAVECDGDTWHGPDRYEADLARKRDLERCGWKFFNLRESLFYVDRALALAPLWEMLIALEVHPSGWVPPVEHSNAGPSGRVRPSRPSADPTSFAAGSTASETAIVIPRAPMLAPATTGRHPHGASIFTAQEEELETATSEEDESEVPAELLNITGSGVSGLNARLPRYEVFSGHASPALTATSARLVEELIAVVEIEGPLLGDRLHQAHVRAAGGQRVGRQIAHALNSAINVAKRRRMLVEDNALSESGVKPRTYRLPSQPLFVVRELGPRSLDQVPPRELAALMRDAAGTAGWADEEDLFRRVLEQYGVQRLTNNAITQLRRVRPLAEEDPAS